LCRFVVYFGKDPVIINDILEKPENSLIRQSRKARGGTSGLNADGFGIGWYNPAISPEPGTFKSVQPAWNDQNLKHLATKISASCFVGHVRASTVGDVNMLNCHPFAYDSYLFVHNGTIRGFDHIRRKLVNMLSEKAYEGIKGQTDSEHFLALIMDTLALFPEPHTLDHWSQAFTIALKKIANLQAAEGAHDYSRLNTVLTDGTKLIATRYASESHETLCLYYALGDHVATEQGQHQKMVPQQKGRKPRALLIASEPLNDYADSWKEIPSGTILQVTADLELSFHAI